MKKWYVVQVYAGYENIVKADIEKGIGEKDLQEKFGDILVPSAKMKQFFTEDDSIKDQQLFPGYILINMDCVPEAIKLVSSTARVIRFLGGVQPVALSQREVDRIISQVKGEVKIAAQKHQFELKKEVEIKEGPFSSFVGIIDHIDEENEKLTVMVSIFGRMTPVELDFSQVSI